jgi:hypothetical protein
MGSAMGSGLVGVRQARVERVQCAI